MLWCVNMSGQGAPGPGGREGVRQRGVAGEKAPVVGLVLFREPVRLDEKRQCNGIMFSFIFCYNCTLM